MEVILYRPSRILILSSIKSSFAGVISLSLFRRIIFYYSYRIIFYIVNKGKTPSVSFRRGPERNVIQFL